MIRLLFNDGTIVVPKEYKMSAPLCTIKTDAEPNASGFKLEKNGVVTFDYSKFNTVYRRLDDGFQLSNDGSYYIPPVEPTPVEPTHSTLMVDGTGYDVIDFFGTSFKIAGKVEDIETLFEEVTEYSVNGVAYENLVFTSATQADDYVQVVFYQKTELDIWREETDLALEELAKFTAENDEAITEIAELVAENDGAISELAELVSSGEGE